MSDDTPMVNCWIRGDRPIAQIYHYSQAAVMGIDLYKLKQPVPSPYRHNLQHVILSQNAELLEEDALLSEVFPVPLPRCHIYIIIEEIKKARPEMKDIFTSDIYVYKIKIPQGDHNQLKEFISRDDAGDRLDGVQLISECFLDIPVLWHRRVVSCVDESPILAKTGFEASIWVSTRTLTVADAIAAASTKRACIRTGDKHAAYFPWCLVLGMIASIAVQV
ncbi:hypothetical protein HD554DRAFT_2175954 [Boletus coccyginus]|nr:hypothetical protein HD554DRAFT_2175954 [Boletus coccyginus]